MSQPISAQDAFDQIVEDLHGAGRLRVWSIIITVFGDLLPPGREDLPASVLQSVLERLRIDSGAVRTAISRLAKDGWIERERSGRNISYRLTPTARPAFDVATRTIYAPTRPEQASRLKVLILPERADVPTGTDLQPLRKGVYVWSGTGAPAYDDALVLDLSDATLPDWVISAFADPMLAKAHLDLKNRFTPLHQALQSDLLDPLESAAARCALIHAWRRLALRHPTVPTKVLPHDWPEAETRQFVRKVYQQLARPVAKWQAENLPVETEGASI